MTTTVSANVSNLAGRVSNVSMLTASQNDGRVTQEALAKATQQASSGYIAQEYGDKDIAPNTRTILNAEQNVLKAGNNNTRLLTIEQRLNRSVQITNRLISIAGEVRQRAMKATDVTSNDTTFSEFCQFKVGEVQLLLNSKDSENRNLFAGTQTSGDAVNLSLAPVPTPGSQPDPSTSPYYLGTPDLNQTTLTDDEAFSYGYTADEEGVNALIHWLKMGAATTPDHDPGSNNTLNLRTMIEGLGTTTQQLADTRTVLGTQLGTIETTLKYNTEDKIFYEGVSSELTEADVTKAIMDQVIAEAQLDVITRLQARTTELFKKILQPV